MCPLVSFPAGASAEGKGIHSVAGIGGSRSGPSAAGDDTSHAMVGLVPAVSILKAQRLTNRDHRHEAGDDVMGYPLSLSSMPICAFG